MVLNFITGVGGLTLLTVSAADGLKQKLCVLGVKVLILMDVIKLLQGTENIHPFFPA